MKVAHPRSGGIVQKGCACVTDDRSPVAFVEADGAKNMRTFFSSLWGLSDFVDGSAITAAKP
jgi:hypothetical protein